MKRIGRYILNTLTVLSLVLCVATVALWVRSYFASECLTIARYDFAPAGVTTEEYHLTSGRGGISMSRLHVGRQPRSNSYDYPRLAYHRYPRNYYGGGVWEDGDWWNRFGIYTNTLVTRLAMFWSLTVPDWLLLLLLLVPPVRAARRLVKSRRASRAGLCPKCGYDLRATPDRCPECGTIPTKAKA